MQLTKNKSKFQEMIDEADRDGDGKVSLHEFISVMSTSSLMHTRILQNLHPQVGARNHHSATKVNEEKSTAQVN